MTMEPLISIVMPAYNAETTIAESIQSVIDQSYINWELWIIDDASQDRTYDIVCAFVQKDTRIKVEKNIRNMGVSATRRKGIQNARSEWIALIDSDDLWDKKKLRKQIDLTLKANDVEFIFTGTAYINKKGELSSFWMRIPEVISYKALLKQNIISCSSVLIKKELLTTYPMRFDDMHEDYATWLQILRNTNRAYGINEPLLIYRLSDHSKSSNKRKAALMTWKVYRYLNINLLEALYYFSCYSVANLKKYRKIYEGFNLDRK